jgi:hypothetical protein
MSSHRGNRLRSSSRSFGRGRRRRLTAEMLEDRRLLHGDELFSGHGPRDAHSILHNPEHVSSSPVDVSSLQCRIQTHVIDGRRYDFAWDPEPAARASATSALGIIFLDGFSGNAPGSASGSQSPLGRPLT